ncbi:hypothetical protein FE844_020885 [Rhizobium indicum]|uniref:hypothetical protein n=1 Tax=Rhizobium indicum TaxID=2583231 RepID=UPI0011067EA3|nr:hypothetical protein [Rhizobium indicum]QKK31887.1 hypothetical protein FE844_020885 [Rhizobium indicum]
MPDSKFWANEDDWFDDAYGYVFLARALKAAGKALYPAEWTGTEPLTREPLSDLWFVVGGRKFLQPRSSVSGPSVDEVRRLLLIHAPEKLQEQLSTNAPRLQPLRTARDASRGAATVYGTPRMELTDQSWIDGVEVAARENERRQAALDRYAGAQKFLKDAMLAGKLKFVLLPLRGAQPFTPPMPAVWWNVKDVSNRFYKCQMDPGKPDSPHIGGDRWIFVDGGDLDVLLKAATPLTKPKDSEEAGEIFEKARTIYDELRAAGPLSRTVFVKACRKLSIPSTVSRPVYSEKFGEQKPSN